MRFALMVLTGLLAAQDPAGTPVMWSLKKGQKVRYEFSHRLVSGSRNQIQQTDLTFVVGLEGGDLGADRTNAITLTIERVALVKSGAHDREDYDSARDKEPPAGSYPRVLSKCVGRPLSMRLGASGRLVTQDEILKMIQAAVDAFPDLKGRSKWDAEGVKVVARRLEWIFRLGFETPKGGPAKVGDTWETKYDSGEVTKGLGTAACRATVKELRGGEAVIEQSVTFDLAAPAAALVKEASGKGALAWDTERNLLKSLGTTSKIVTTRGEVTHTLTVALLPEAK